MKCPGYGLVELLKDKGNMVGVEIGCDEAVTAKYLLDSLPQLKLISIDPYVVYTDWNGNVLENRELLYQRVMREMEPYGDRFTLIRSKSGSAVDSFAEGELDFIFIDGIHTYVGVIEDCKNYYGKVKTDGLFAGHDFSVIPDVNRAVLEFANEVGKGILTTEVDVWYWYK